MRGLKTIVKAVLITAFLTTLSFSSDINIDKKLQEAQALNKQVMYFFHIPRCPYCDRMLKKNFKDENILALINQNFVLIDIYTADKIEISFKDFKGTPKEFAKHIGASAYPATLFMDQSGEVVHKAIGYRNIEEFTNELKYAATKSYKTKDLETFIMDLELAEDDE